MTDILLRENFNYKRDSDSFGESYRRTIRKLYPVEMTCVRVCTGGLLKGLDIPVRLNFVDRHHADHWVGCVKAINFKDYHYTDFQIRD